MFVSVRTEDSWATSAHQENGDHVTVTPAETQ